MLTVKDFHWKALIRKGFSPATGSDSDKLEYHDQGTEDLTQGELNNGPASTVCTQVMDTKLRAVSVMCKCLTKLRRVEILESRMHQITPSGHLSTCAAPYLQIHISAILHAVETRSYASSSRPTDYASDVHIKACHPLTARKSNGLCMRDRPSDSTTPFISLLMSHCSSTTDFHQTYLDRLFSHAIRFCI